MKRIFTLVVLTILVGSTAFSQRSYVNYDKDSKWFFGINGGATWHSKTEVDNLIRGGYGFTFGRSFGMKPEKLFSWDLRLRYLHGWWGGQSDSQFALDSTTTGMNAYGNSLQTYQDSLGYFIPNFRTQLMSGSIELALNTNRLRQNTGWNFQIFGGIGIKGYNAKADLLDGTQAYDYSTLNSPSKVDLLNFQDGNYETYVTGGDSDFEVDWMGSFGAGISYQVSPWASIGLSHKMTWTRNDDKFDIVPGTSNDIYHYSNAGIRFHLLGGSHGTPPPDIVDEDPDINNFDQKEDPKPIVQRPIVDIYDPGSSPYTVEVNHFTIRANVHHVAGRHNITFKQNGNINNNFSYNVASDKFSSNVVLQPGQNIFEITGVNEAGQDYESTIIIYKKEVPKIEPPIVTITNPPYSPYTTNNSSFNFAATVLNVDSKSQIKVYFNGAYLSNFTYNVSSKALYTTLNLQEGTNTVTVTATNQAGSDSKTVKIIYEKPIVKQPPVVNFVVPSTDPFYTTTHTQNITASVLNVDGKSDIQVFVNGYVKTNFSYNASTKQVQFSTNLIEGANVVEVIGTNDVGSDHETTTIIYNKPEVPKPPVVTYLDPVTDPTIVYTSSYNVEAKVLHVNSASDITLKINGIQSYNFNYSASSKLMTFTTNLLLGSNVIEITATNTVGQDQETTTIIRKKTVPQAPPVVNITYPATDNQVFNTPNVTLAATVLNVSSPANIVVWVNGNQTSAFNYNIATKILTLPLNMVQGVNTIKITGSNTAGSDTDIRKIIYKIPEVPKPPTVAFVNPPSSPYVVSNQNFVMTATTTNIDSKSQISLMMNGTLVPDALYTFTSNHQIIYNADLILGNNIFEIVVTNNDGSDDAMAIVTYEEEEIPCIIPTVGYIHPVPYSTVNDPNVTIDAQINNYTVGTTVELQVNGVSQGYMSFNPNTSIASKNTALLEGSNAIKVIVTNDCGTNHATFTLNYVAPEAPCVDPTVTANTQLPSVTQSSTVSVAAGVTEIDNANQITVTLNGTATPFQFDLGTNTITVDNALLAIGNNTIVITATNECGSASITYHIVRKECHLPIISNISHNNGTTVNDNSITFTAAVSNANETQIELIVNNISQSFTFNQGVLSSALSLVEGSNTIVINATNECGTATESITITHEIPCEPISFTYVSPASGQATVTDAGYSVQLHVTGSLESSGISATLNGTHVSALYDPVTGEITIAGLTLAEGSNTIAVNLTNDCSSETVTYNITYNGCQPPVISLNGITSGSVVNTNTVDLSGTIQNANGASNIVLTVNGTNQSFNFNELDGSFNASINLVEGSNTIVLTVNGCEVKTESHTITYEVPCQPIAYNLMSPASNSQTVVEETYEITLGLLEVANQQQISVTHNGSAHPFVFDNVNHILTIDGITLINGANTIVVTATNDCSAETITYNIQYNGCQPPVITLGSNANAVTNAVYNFTASVTNIANQNELQVLHNNAPVTFVYDAQSGSISAEVSLIEGQNTIQINANGCAADSKTFNVTYTIPCDPIVFALSTPAQTETSVADENYAISLVAQHANPSSISVTVNGNPATHTYSNDIITINGITLVDGVNTIVVSMSNDCSSETVTYTIHHDGCDAPVINISGNPDAVTNSAYNLSAQVSNISNQNELVVQLNGANVPFTFDSNTGAVNAQLTLVEGANSISITANGCASASETLNVTYTIPCDPVSYTLASPTTQTLVVQGATTSISLNVSNVASASDISATLNGTAITPAFANNVITLNGITLVEGQNTLTITFGNQCSSETVTYTIESDQCDTPVINVSNPSTTTNDPLYTFTCNIQNITNGSDLEVKINGQVVNSSFANGVLTAQMSLQVGANEIVVTANGCETTSVTYTITYEVPCDPVTFTHLVPANNDTIFQETTTTSVSISANGVEQSGVSVTLNGATIPFTFVSGTITVNTQNLQVGHNTILISMTNECSSADAIFHIDVGAPCNPPVITFTNSSTNVTDSNLNFTATVTNVTDPAAIVFKLNGQVVPFNFNNGNVTATLALNLGDNVVGIEAAGCENAIGSWTVHYQPACDPVTYSLVSPSSNSETVEDANYTVTLNAQHVSSASNVTATVNGTAVTPQFNGQSGVITISGITLNVGSNTIVVNFGNECSNESVTYTVTYNEPSGPCGPRFNPGNSEWQFCLVTPGGTYNRDDLANNANFSYSGPASAAYFKPIAGGGDAIVNGQAYPVQNGQYYLFEGNLTVDVASNHPGSMGHWEICIESDATPQSGNGNNRPPSPCEQVEEESNPNIDVEGDGTVHLDQNYCTKIKCLGESVVYNNNQDAFVKIKYSIDGGSSWYYFNNDNFVNGGENITVNTPAGSDIVIKAECENQNGNWSNTETSNTGSQYVYVLQNGDQAPDFAPAQGQAAVETFLAGYVDGQGNVTIGPNDVIYLFELRFVGNYGIDYQDCVMLITMDEGSSCSPPPSDQLVSSKSINNGNNSGNQGINQNTGGNAVKAPTITNVNPTTTSTTVKSNTYNFSAKVGEVTSRDKISMTVNGKAFSGFKFNGSTGDLTARLTLKAGANVVKVTANGDAGKSTSRTYTVTYDNSISNNNNTGGNTQNTNITKIAPKITNVSPATTSAKAGAATYTFKAKVENVTSKSDLQLTLNGTKLTTFTYSSGSKMLTAVLRLKGGDNVIKLVANANGKSASRTYTVTYGTAIQTNTGGNNTGGNNNNTNPNLTKIAPKITNVNPSTTSAKAGSATYTFKAKVENVASKSDIQLTLNGTKLTTFTYSSSSKQVTAVLRLKGGDNVIKLNATGNGKTASRTYTIKYGTAMQTNTGGNNNSGSNNTNTNLSKLSPKITRVTPSTSSAKSTSATYMFKAKVANVASKADITLSLNGRTVSNFTFSSSTGTVSAVVKLNPGSNQIRLVAKNSNNTATDNFTITYIPRVNKPSPGNNSGNSGGTIKTNGGSTNSGKTGGTIKTTGGNTSTNKTSGTTNTNKGNTSTNKTGGTIKTTGGNNSNNSGSGNTINKGTIKKNTGGGTTNSGGTIKTNGGTNSGGSGNTINKGTIKKNTGGGTTTTSRRG